MIRIAHRVNTIDDLQSTPIEFGVEIDVRTSGSTLILAHDFPSSGEKLEDFLGSYKHALLVINVKEDGLEDAIVELPNFRQVEDYFFLDQPMPTLLKSSRKGLKTAIRVSEFEDAPKKDTGAAWVWIDSFSGNWEHLEYSLDYAKALNLRTCLVAPELQGRFELKESLELFKQYGARLDAVCTKNMDLWQ